MLYDTAARVDASENGGRKIDPQGLKLENHVTTESPGEKVKHQRKHSLVLSGGTETAFVEMDPSERYGRFDEELGRGACKVVYKAFDTQEGREVAWNKVDLRNFTGGLGDGGIDNEEHDRILAEIRVLRALKHKNIMSFYKWWYNEEKGQVNFISELFASGTLRRYRKRHRHLGDDVLKRWGWQILSGLVYLHGHNPPIVHRDLKCDNIFINGADGVVKIGDLGLATMLHGRTAPQSVLGTPEFMAPELYDEFYDDRVDVYAFGMVMLELATLEYPYSECSNAAQIYRKVSLGVRPAGLQKVACRELADFINTCIAPLEQRPRSRQLLKHPYFTSIRSTLHPSKTELLLSASSSQHSGERVIGPPKSSNAVLQTGGLQAPTSCGSIQTSSHDEKMLSRSLSASPVPQQHQEQNSMISSDDLMRELVESKDPRKMEGNSTSSTATPPPSHADSAHQGIVDARSPYRERTVSPFAPQHTPTTGPKRRRGVCRCAATNRCFEFAGRYREDRDKRLLSLRLKIVEPDESSRTIEFEFDITSDTATSVATEMVAVLELSPDDAHAISAAMESEIKNLLPSLEGQASCNLAQAAAELQQELKDTAIQHASGEEAFADVQTAAGKPVDRLYDLASGTASMASFQSVESMHSTMQSAVASPEKGGKSSPLHVSAEEFHDNLKRIGSTDVFPKVHRVPQPSGTPECSRRHSFEERLSPNGDLLRDNSMEKRSLHKLYANLEEVADTRKKTSTPPLIKPPCPLQTKSSLSGPPSLNGDEEKQNKDDKLQQAMNALKVVESRSLDSLGGNGSSNSLRGIPMASSKAPEHQQGSLTTNSSRDSNIDSILISHPSMDMDNQLLSSTAVDIAPNNYDHSDLAKAKVDDTLPELPDEDKQA